MRRNTLLSAMILGLALATVGGGDALAEGNRGESVCDYTNPGPWRYRCRTHGGLLDSGCREYKRRVVICANSLDGSPVEDEPGFVDDIDAEDTAFPDAITAGTDFEYSQIAHNVAWDCTDTVDSWTGRCTAP